MFRGCADLRLWSSSIQAEEWAWSSLDMAAFGAALRTLQPVNQRCQLFREEWSDEDPEEWERILLEDGELVELMLESCSIPCLTQEFCSGLPSLKKLWLAENGIKQLPDTLGDLSNLDAFISKLTKLVRLGLAANLFMAFPAQICSLEGLEIIDLSENKVSEVTSAIRSLANLTRLDLHTNELETLPNEVSALTSLKTL
eukprot:gene31675-6877_t